MAEVFTISGLLRSQLIPAFFVGYIVFVCIHRLYLSPLAKFPGPRIAALTTWYAAYHDIWRGGQYIWEVEEMHRKYGPVVRIRPDTLHVNDPTFVDKLYSQSPKQRRERYWTSYQSFMAPGSMISSADHDMHRRRRATLHPYFSMANVRRLEPILNDTLASLLHRMEGWAKEGKPVQIQMGFRAATKDIIHSYAFGEGRSRKCLDMEDCNKGFFDCITPNRFSVVGVHFLWLMLMFSKLPPSVMLRLVPRIGIFAQFMEGLIGQIEEIRNAKDIPEGKTIFHEIMRSDIPESEKETMRLADEAMILVTAGSETTASTLAVIMYHLLADPALLARLKAELEVAMPDPNAMPEASKLDSLPLLNAIIEECIRLYPGASFRQDRVAPDEDLFYTSPSGETITIPKGTPIGMTAPLVNRHPDLYERPNDFLPERYLENPGLKKHQFAFSKGTRQCLGINLAYQELQTFTAGIFRKYDLYETDVRDISLFADYIAPSPYPGSLGLRVVIRE
ncbi:cytochrome P450 [Xylariaceae sp. FL1019]|nr:cytochrome P450 [Xylariaceae sp. FL1019]